MVLYFLISGILAWNLAFAVTEKDLPKLPQNIQLNHKQEKEKAEKIDLDDPILESIKGNIGKDLNVIPWKESQEKEIEKENKHLAPGLKSHKKQPPEPAEEPVSPPLMLKGLVLFGDKDLVCKKDLTLFSGFETFGLPNELDDPTLEKQIKPLYCKKQFNYETVDQIIKFLETYYRDNELGIVTISIPIQDISTQVLSLVVKLAKVDLISIHGNRYLSDDYILDEIPIVSEEIINLEKNDRNVAFFNLNPMQSASIDYPSKNIEGKRDVSIQIGDRYPLRLYFGLDNQGLQLLGPFRSFYGANYANLFGSSDVLSFQYTTSADFHRYKSFTGDYKVFVSPYLILDFFGGYASDIYERDDKDLKRGYSAQGSLRFDFPWYVTTPLKVFFGIGADFKATDNNLEYIEYDPRFAKTASSTQVVGSFSSHWHTKHLKGEFSVDGYLSLGDIFGSATEGRYQELRLGAKTFYSYVKASFDNAFYVYKTAGLRIRAEGQLASTNLLPSEEFAIGGLQTVRGYIENAAVGDYGYYASAELLMPSFSIMRKRENRMGNTIEDQVCISGFFDIGKVYAKRFYLENATTQPAQAMLMSAGPRFVYALDDYFSVDINVGFKLKTTYLDPTSTCRANCQMMLKF